MNMQIAELCSAIKQVLVVSQLEREGARAGRAARLQLPQHTCNTTTWRPLLLQYCLSFDGSPKVASHWTHFSVPLAVFSWPMVSLGRSSRNLVASRNRKLTCCAFCWLIESTVQPFSTCSNTENYAVCFSDWRPVNKTSQWLGGLGKVGHHLNPFFLTWAS